jgi:hypothetical protein
MKSFHSLISTALHGAVLFAGVTALPAAAVLSTPVTVNLIAPGGATSPGFTDPTPVNASQVITTVGQVINLASSGAVGSLLLPSEQIFLSGDSIRISSYAGDDTGGVYRTGWLGLDGNPARYDFSGLAIAGRDITGFTLFGYDGFGSGGFEGAVPGTFGVSMADTNADGSLDTLRFNLDALRFKPRDGLGSGDFHADFRVELNSILTPVPEASGMAMALAGLGALALVVARRKRPDGASVIASN